MASGSGCLALQLQRGGTVFACFPLSLEMTHGHAHPRAPSIAVALHGPDPVCPDAGRGGSSDSLRRKQRGSACPAGRLVRVPDLDGLLCTDGEHGPRRVHRLALPMNSRPAARHPTAGERMEKTTQVAGRAPVATGPQCVSFLGSLIKGWNRFWFDPVDPTTLGLIRLCCGLLTLYVHWAYTGTGAVVCAGGRRKATPDGMAGGSIPTVAQQGCLNDRRSCRGHGDRSKRTPAGAVRHTV